MTSKAASDLNNIYKYISEELFAKSSATNILERIEKIMRLREFPFSCNYVDDEYLKNKGYRKLIVENYIAFYLIEEDIHQIKIYCFGGRCCTRQFYTNSEKLEKTKRKSVYKHLLNFVIYSKEENTNIIFQDVFVYEQKINYFFSNANSKCFYHACLS